uniref:LAM_G_DOMAIN domain-containing protein n=1 Tax=Macrostomum lignano TaxID=282301 RepID=A0A1I8IUM1_9PLAT
TYQARTVLATVSNRRGQFWQLFLKGGAVHLRDSITGDHRTVYAAAVNDGQSHVITGRREGQGVSLSVDKVRAQEDLYALHRDLLEPDGRFAHGGLRLGGGNFSEGVGRPETAICFLIKFPTALPRPDGDIVSPFRPGLRLPPNGGYADVGVGGGGGGGVDSGLLFPGSDGVVNAVGAGAIVLAGGAGGGGGGAAGAGGLAAAGVGAGGLGVVSAWIAGLLLALLLLLSSLLWAFCHCKPGYCLCCAKGAAGGGYAVAEAEALSNEMNLSLMKATLSSQPPTPAINAATNTELSAKADIDAMDTRNGLFGAGAGAGAGGGGGASVNARSATLVAGAAAAPLLTAADSRAATYNYRSERTELTAVRNQFGTAFSSGRRRRHANGATASVDGAINQQTDIGLVDRSAVDGRPFVHLQSGAAAGAGGGFNHSQHYLYQQQQQQQQDAMSIRSVPPPAGAGGVSATWGGSRFERTTRTGMQHQNGSDAMSDMMGTAYRPRQTLTVGRDRVLDIASNYHMEAVGAEASAAQTQDNVFLSENIKVDCALITQNSKYVVTGNAAGPAQVWDCETGDLIKVMDGRDVGCTEIHLASEDSVLLGLVLDEASGRHRLQMWDFRHGREVANQEDVFCSTVAINRSGTHAVVACVDSDEKACDLLVWDIVSNSATRTLPLPAVPGLTEVITYLHVSREDQFVVAGFPNTASGTATYLVYDLSLPSGTLPLQVDFDAVVSCTELGAGEAVTGSAKGELLVWALGTGLVERPIVLPNGQLAHRSPIKATAWSADGRLFASGGSDALIKVWDMTSESLLFTLEGHTEDVSELIALH